MAATIYSQNDLDDGQSVCHRVQHTKTSEEHTCWGIDDTTVRVSGKISLTNTHCTHKVS